MRVIAGGLGGRQFDSPGTNKTHPMSDKMRGALFNILGDIEELTVLDAFSGSGALSFEAISRGAASVIAIDSDRQAQHTIAQNIKLLKLNGRVKLIKASTSAWLQTNSDVIFDLILCDPPYDDLQPNLINRLAEHVKPGGLLVLSCPSDHPAPELAAIKQVQAKEYGDAKLIFYS